MKSQTTKVFAAMSGGVDSSVAALLLKNDGYDVVGIYMKNWSQPVLGELCPWEQDQEDARRVAQKIGIPFYTFDFEEEYKKEVVDHMIREYAAGRTPNPDVTCNKVVKFGLFLKKVLALGTNYIATGHYTRKREIKNQKSKIKNFELLSGVDKSKDQSYFLWTLTQEQLQYCLFPIGDYTKQEVREIARKAGLPTAGKPDSQGVCFIGEFSMQEFLKQYIPVKPGVVMTASGKRIGEHEGVNFYTIGQRHLGISNIKNQKSNSMPVYVAGKDVRTNTLVVAEGPEHPSLFKNEVVASNVNWISGEVPQLPFRAKARIRYRQPLQTCTLTYADDTLTDAEDFSARVRVKSATVRLVFDKPQRAVTPGQSCVFYDEKGEVMLGGGVIVG